MNNAALMTLEDVMTADFADLEFHDVIWESCAVFLLPETHEIHLVNEEGTANWYFSEEEYGRSWRCWNGVPTPEQRESAGWADD